MGTICSRNADVSVTELTRPEVRLTNSEPVVADVNGTVRLVCDLEAHPDAIVTWFKDDIAVENVDSQRMTALQSGVLQIINVTLTDAGKYTCSAHNLQGNETSDSFQLNITTLASVPSQPLPPSPPLIVAGPQNATIMAGSLYLLECAVSTTSVEIEWTRGDGLSIPQDRSKKVGFSNLMLSELQGSDSGVYVCTVRSSSSVMQQAQALLNVTEPPVFTVKPEDLTRKESAKPRLHCAAEGIPTPTLTWLHNGRVVNSDEGRTERQDNNDLVIWNIREEDQGFYQCVASNEAGEVQASALLTVELPDKRPDAPRNLTALALGANTIMLAWIPPNQTITAYTLHYSKSAGGSEEIVPVEGTVNSHMIDSLKPYTNYTFYMRSYANAPSVLSQTVMAMTWEGLPSCGPHFWLISDSPNSIEINWQAVAQECRNGIITKYRYCIQQTGRKDYVCTEMKNTEQRMVRVRSLRQSTTYSVAMAAGTIMGFGTDSSWLMIRTTDPNPRHCKVPPAYTLEWSIVNSSYVQVTWHNPEPLRPEAFNVSIEGFHLTITTEADGSVETLYLGAEQRAHAFSDLDPGASYDVLLYAVNECGYGQEWVETIAIPVEDIVGSESAVGDPTVWPPPYNLQATAVTSNSIDLIWDPPDTPHSDFMPDYYLISYTTFGMNEGPVGVYSSSTQVSVSGLRPFTVYRFTVQAVVRTLNEDIKGQPSQIGYFRTDPDEPSAPTNVNATSIDPHAVAVKWQPPSHSNGIIKSYMILYNEDLNQPETVWNRTERNGDTHKDVIADLSSDTLYYFRVRASNQAGPGPASKPVLVRTLSVDPPPKKPFVMDPNLQKGILASIVLVTFLILLCTVVLVCRDRINKRNQQQQQTVCRAGNGSVGYRQSYPYGSDNRSNTHHQTPGGMDMEMSPMLPSNGSLQGNGTPGRRLCNGSSSNHSPYFSRGVSTNQGAGSTAAANSASHEQTSDRDYHRERGPECQVIVHQQEIPLDIHHQQQHSINQDVESAVTGADLTTHTNTHYLPGHHFNSGQSSSPQISGQNSPHLHTDQDEEVVNEESVLSSAAIGAVGGQQQQPQHQHRWRERDELGLHLPYTLSLATTSGTGAPCGSHDSNLPLETNHREDSDNLDIWGGVNDDVDDDNDSQRPQSCGSTGGDSGMIDGEEWDTQDTSPDFIQKALLVVSGDVSLYTV
ncbi:protogenin B-like isoform X2 [Amphiura filiformis]|uniref:protogenin B-like isoform X2 n=1 Tax=Amphiura filiformis TaxID=82378 RepID=UPI003B20F92F